MTDDARKPDVAAADAPRAVRRDALNEALEGSNLGSDTRAGSLRGGSASGSERDPDQAVIDRGLADVGRATAAPRTPGSAEAGDVKNTGAGPGETPDVRKGGPATG
jgi:hypothetical protein